MNTVNIIGTYVGADKSVYGDPEWAIRIDVDGTIFRVKIWEGLYEECIKRATGVLVGLKGHLVKDGAELGVMAERVSFVAKEGD